MTGSADREMRTGMRRSLVARSMFPLLIPALVLGLAACAPEPGEGGDPTSPGVDSGHPVDGGGKGEGDDGGESGGETSPQDDPALKQQKLPADFPRDGFALPEHAVIDDVGSREPGSWYLVLRAEDSAQADDWWTQITRSSGFSVRDEDQTDDGGRSATLLSDALTVQALTIPQSDGSVLLSYDLGPTTG